MEENECCICFEQISYKTLCNHDVCYKCGEKIKDCPLCRRKLYFNDDVFIFNTISSSLFNNYIEFPIGFRYRNDIPNNILDSDFISIYKSKRKRGFLFNYEGKYQITFNCIDKDNIIFKYEIMDKNNIIQKQIQNNNTIEINLKQGSILCLKKIDYKDMIIETKIKINF